MLQRLGAAGETFRQFLQRKGQGVAAPFLGMAGLVPVEGEIPGQLAEKRGQHPRALRRYGVPGVQVGIADVFLAVLPVLQNIHGYPHTVCPVF